MSQDFFDDMKHAIAHIARGRLKTAAESSGSIRHELAAVREICDETEAALNALDRAAKLRAMAAQSPEPDLHIADENGA